MSLRDGTKKMSKSDRWISRLNMTDDATRSLADMTSEDDPQPIPANVADLEQAARSEKLTAYGARCPGVGIRETRLGICRTAFAPSRKLSELSARCWTNRRRDEQVDGGSRVYSTWFAAARARSAIAGPGLEEAQQISEYVRP